jgi:NAD(P)-dependent dehydrogenase (short-subunit alcohol dehydrogenase family)
MVLKGKTAIVTGASKGIGLAIVEELLERGVKVAGWSRTDPGISDNDFQFVKADVQSVESIEAAYKATVAKFGATIDFLINNAGLGIPSAFEDTKPEDWQTMFRTNVDSIFYISRLLVPQMKQNDFGHIINISSIAGLNGVKGYSAYSATKHAVTGLTHSMMMELRDFGIKVTGVYPGSTNTHFFEGRHTSTPPENMMRPEDIAKSVVELLDTHPNYLPGDIELRPLRPQGKPKK